MELVLCGIAEKQQQGFDATKWPRKSKERLLSTRCSDCSVLATQPPIFCWGAAPLRRYAGSISTVRPHPCAFLVLVHSVQDRRRIEQAQPCLQGKISRMGGSLVARSLAEPSMSYATVRFHFADGFAVPS